MAKMVVKSMSVFASIFFEINALDVPPKIEAALRVFYENHYMPTEGVIFRQDESYFNSNPSVAATTRGSKITLCPAILKRISKSIKEKSPLAPWVHLVLLHEYGHVCQTFSNELLDEHMQEIPFSIDGAHKREAAAEFFALSALHPKIFEELEDDYSHRSENEQLLNGIITDSEFLHRVVNTYEKCYAKENPGQPFAGGIEGPLKSSIIKFAYIWLLKTRIARFDRTAEFDNGSHPNKKQLHEMKKIAQKIRDREIQEALLRGFTYEEIMHGWPYKPVIRRIAYSSPDVNGETHLSRLRNFMAHWLGKLGGKNVSKKH